MLSYAVGRGLRQCGLLPESCILISNHPTPIMEVILVILVLFVILVDYRFCQFLLVYMLCRSGMSKTRMEASERKSTSTSTCFS